MHSLAPVFWWLGPFSRRDCSIYVHRLRVADRNNRWTSCAAPASCSRHDVHSQPVASASHLHRVQSYRDTASPTEPRCVHGTVPRIGDVHNCRTHVHRASATNALLIAILYRRVHPKIERIIPLAIALEGMLCLGLYLTNTALFQLGLIR